MRVVYRNKYKAVRDLWKKVDMYVGLSRFIAGSTVLATFVMYQWDWVHAIMAFVSGATVWSIYALLTDGKVKAMRERIDDLQARKDCFLGEFPVALMSTDVKGKYTLGISIDGRVHRMKHGEEEFPVVVDCLTDTALVSTELANIINNGRTK